MSHETRLALIAALHSLHSDASYAWKRALESDFDALGPLGESIKRVERLVIEADMTGALRRRRSE